MYLFTLSYIVLNRENKDCFGSKSKKRTDRNLEKQHVSSNRTLLKQYNFTNGERGSDTLSGILFMTFLDVTQPYPILQK